MPSALSWDLRSRIVSACQAAELTQGEIADLFQVHLKTVEKLWRHFRRTGSAEAKPHGGGVKAHLAGHEADLRRLVAEQSDRTLAEYVALLWERYQVITSVPVLSRTLKALGLPQKKSHWRRWNNSARKRSGRGGAFRAS
jgi:transposase